MSIIADLTERDLIARIRALLRPPPPWLVVGVGDDAAVVEYERNQLEVLTVDAVVEGVHFDRRFTPPDAIGHRALAVNLSDLAAMGASPRLALLSMVLPPALPVVDFDAIVGGLTALAATHRLHVVGGNLTRSPGPLMIDVTAIGTAKRRQVLTRSGARPGDELYLTGAIGGAAAGLQVLRSEQSHQADPHRWTEAVRRYLYPQPRVRAGMLAGRARGASACMDLSDGLLDALQQVAAASGVGVALDSSSVAIDPAARAWWDTAGKDPFAEAIRGGDDYELLFAVPRRRRRAFLAAMTHSHMAVAKIGACTKELELEVDGSSVNAAAASSFTHFR